MRRVERRRRCSKARVSRPLRLGQAGQSLIEVMISIMLVAIIMSSVMGAALTAKESGGKADRKVIAGLATQQLSSQLGNFVTQYWDYTAAKWYTGCAGGSCVSDIDGPMTTSGAACPSGSGACTWEWGNMPDGCAAATCITDDCGGGTTPCYALQRGAHRLTHFLPGWMENAPYNGQACYYVCGPADAGSIAYACGGSNATATCAGATMPGGYSPSASIAVNWKEP